MSLVSFVGGIEVKEAQRFVNLMQTGMDVVRFAVDKLKDDGRISAREGLEILGVALGHHGICVDCAEGDEASRDRPEISKTPPKRRQDDQGYPLRLKDSETREGFEKKVAELASIVDGGVHLESDGEPSYRVRHESGERLG
ncbi:MAG: hypothetical protein KME41_03620 [Candidatus Thiodiazotropha sp. (ex Lucina pensylvanica)]|nr:hypothetical protein [Candidatus Thiodiazotropha sp. (ex Lucina pensylvanica)]MBT3033280.1 hypothetical protein [Candidatus Thiodiazotropha sp. (ex Lucina pensylvanica)]MBT3050965.1 hypothetical protein [Candidatus Thiodiazotropha sp. (ex Codakia orbicularis)]MBV2119499.1 hypothetical protein [Candidatus Thiodiazotropha sp. (ex Lucina aurantia)]